MKSILHIVLLAGCVEVMAQQPDKPENYQSPLYNRIDHILLSPDGQMLVASDSTGHLLFWGRDGSLRKILRAHRQPVNAVACSADGALLATADNREIIVWNFITGEKINSSQSNSPVLSLAFSSDAASLYYSTNDGVYKTETKALVTREKISGSMDCVLNGMAWGNNLICGSCTDGSIRLFEWNGAVLAERKTADEDAENLLQMIFMDDERIALISKEGAAIWNTTSGKYAAMKGLPESYTAIGYGGNRIFYAGDRTGKVYSFNPTWKDENIPSSQPVKQPETKIETTATGIPKSINGRLVKAQPPVEVNLNSLDIYVWDDEREDGDTISLSLNGEWILQDYMITTEKKKLTVNLAPGKANYLILYAHNLGKLPPNTAVISFNDGIAERKLTLESDLKRCAAVNFVLKR